MMNDIAGNLPEWFPDDIREHALKCQRNLLRRHGMTLDTLREAVEEIIEVHREHFTDPNYAIYEYRSMTIRDGKPDFADPDRAILARCLYAATLDEKDGLALLIGNDHAGRVEKGDRYSAHQSAIASNPRGKIGDGGETNNQIIGQLALASEYEELSAKELWTHYFSVLNDDLQRNPKESKADDDWRKIVIEYDFKDGRKKITGGQFAKVVSDYRTGKKLP